MAKEKTINPAQQQRKKDKDRAIKKCKFLGCPHSERSALGSQTFMSTTGKEKANNAKAKQELAVRRNEKLSRRNPQRIQRQIEELTELKNAHGGSLSARDARALQDLEKELSAVQKAREAVGAPASGPTQGHSQDAGAGRGRGNFRSDRGGRGRGDFGGRGGRGGGGPGFHRDRPFHDGNESDDSTTSSVLNIPMPRDTPPPIPEEFAHLSRPPPQQHREPEAERTADGKHVLPPRPQVAPAQTVYEAAPQVRDLVKEVTSRFVPAAFRQKARAAGSTTATESKEPAQSSAAGLADEDDEDPFRLLEEEERKFKAEMESERSVGSSKPLQPMIEEVDDEEA
jgi:hypothetical protein